MRDQPVIQQIPIRSPELANLREAITERIRNELLPTAIDYNHLEQRILEMMKDQ
jgi:DNA polymerase I-like protein with 3'-5' exonuclease and polymerase domains